MRKEKRANSDLSSDWRRWIAENKIEQVPDTELLEILVQNGIDEKAALSEIRQVAAHPYIKAAIGAAQRLKKLESLLDVYRSLDRLSATFGEVERRSNISEEEFSQEYYSRNRPVILTDLMQGWKAMSLWTPEYLKERYGNVEVEITVERNSDVFYEINVEEHKRKILLGDYVDMVLSGGETNDYYMVANNHTLELEGMKGLLNDINSFPTFIHSRLTADKAFLIFGPAGTVTPLHHDYLNVLLAQVYGRKQVKLIPSNQLHLMYNYKSVFSEVECDNPDYEKFPLFKETTIIDLTLHPGEVLFLPVGWWHYVKALDVSITVNMDNFIFPNEYNFFEPHLSK
jgi:hypothetical protein